MRFGDKIKNLRTDADLKQKEVAEILKVSRSSISMLVQIIYLDYLNIKRVG